MGSIKDIFAFKTVFSEQKTFLVYSISKKEKINYSQVQMFQNEEYGNYFVPFQCTKTATANKISYDISGLTALSEYLKSSMGQNEYFDVIRGIQKIASFCQQHHLSYDNLVCAPKYMYYHNVLKRVLMAYVPLNNAHYIRASIPQCLVKIHKCAENVIITDGNYMNAYEAYLNSIQETADKKNNQTFSPNSLLHFFNTHEQESQKSWIIENEIHRDEDKMRHSIADQISGGTGKSKIMSFPSPAPAPQPVPVPQPAPQPAPVPQPVPQPAPVPQPVPQPFPEPIDGTIVRKKVRAYLMDSGGRRIDITGNPFKVGRNQQNDLVIPAGTVSGSHAEICQKDGSFYVKDISSNGTYLNDSNERALNAVLKDGDRIYFDEYCYVFRQEKEQNDTTNTGTLMVSRRSNSVNSRGNSFSSEGNSPSGSGNSFSSEGNSANGNSVTNDSNSFSGSSSPFSGMTEKPLAYIRRASDGGTIGIMSYPFSDDAIPGVSFQAQKQAGRLVLYVENQFCPSLRLENTPVGIGSKEEIFSGCSLYINGAKFMFFVEN